jgi:hypothetical protein
VGIRHWHIGQLLTMWVGFLGAFALSAVRLADAHRSREELSRDFYSTFLSLPPRDSAQRADLDSTFRSWRLSSSGNPKAEDDLARYNLRELLEALKRSERLRSALLVYADSVGRSELSAYYRSELARLDRRHGVLTTLTGGFVLIPLLLTWMWFGGRKRPEATELSASRA